MSLGGRTVKRGGIFIAASLVSIPREPLLFLYPRWARFSSTASQAAAPAIDRHTVDKLTKPGAATSSPRSSLSSVRHGSLRASERQVEVEGDGSRHRRAGDAHAISAKTDGLNIVTGSADRLQAARAKTRSSPTAATAERYVESIISKVSSRERFRQQKNFFRDQNRMDSREARDWQPDWSKDWHLILDTLCEHTPMHGEWFPRSFQLTASAASSIRLLDSYDKSIWDIAENHDSSIVLGSKRSPSGAMDFIFSGSKIALIRSLKDVLRIAPDSTIKKLLSSSTEISRLPAKSNLLPHRSTTTSSQAASDERASRQASMLSVEKVPDVDVIASDEVDFSILTSKEDVFRYVVAEPRRITYGRMCLDQINLPDIWTRESFFDYVKALTSISPPNSVGSNRHNEHVQLRMKTLCKLFDTLTGIPRMAISRAACHEALRFLVKVSNITEVRNLFANMDVLRVPKSKETFNIMLQGAAKAVDLQNFHYISNMMIHRGLYPNAGTWIPFIQALPDWNSKIIVAVEMKRHGLLSRVQTLRDVCKELVELEITQWIKANPNPKLNHFISYMDARYGKHWLSLEAGTKIIKILGERGLISGCLDMLYVMDAHFINPDQCAINTIIHHCRIMGNLDGAIALIRSLLPAWGFRANQGALEDLFWLARHSASYNVLKVVWKIACLSGQTTLQMRKRVYKDMMLSWALPENYRSLFAKFVRTYGGIIVNCHHPANHCNLYHLGVADQPVEWNADLNNRRSSPLQPQPLPIGELDQPGKERRALYWSAVQEVVSFEANMPRKLQHYELVLSMDEMLLEAREMDQAWKISGDNVNKDQEWLMNNAIKVPIKVQYGRSSKILQL